MGEARSTSALTVEDLEKKPKKNIEIITPLKNVEVKYGDACQLFVYCKIILSLFISLQILIGFALQYLVHCNFHLFGEEMDLK